jgi:hypothetical protein
MLLDDPFPLDQLPPRVRQTILDEFGGHHPTILEVATIPDARWLEMPAIGPKVLSRMHTLTREARKEAQIPSVAEMTDADLLAEYERLKNQRRAVEDQIKAVRAELLLRRLLSVP